MTDRLPKRVDCDKLVSQQITLSGQLALSDCQHLANLCEPIEAAIQAELCFGLDERPKPVITGWVKAALPLTCQRCLGSMTYDIESHFSVRPMMPAKVAQLPEGLEYILLDEAGLLDVVALVEEECLLALPLVPKHDDEHCSSYLTTQPEPVLELVVKKPNPFQVLKNLKSIDE